MRIREHVINVLYYQDRVELLSFLSPSAHPWGEDILSFTFSIYIQSRGDNSDSNLETGGQGKIPFLSPEWAVGRSRECA